MPSPEKLTIETPEQIALEFTLASVGSRFLALGIDTLLQGGGFCALGLMAIVLSGMSPIGAVDLRTWGFAALLLVAFSIYYGYFAVFEALWNGQTPGKRAIGLRVIATSGRPLSVYEAILRNVVRIADQTPGVYAVGILSVFLTARHQRLGDLAAGTVVVHERPMEHHQASHEVREPGTRHGARRLQPDEVALMETFLLRRGDLADLRRASTARKVAARIADRLGVTSVEDPEQFLEDVLAEDPIDRPLSLRASVPNGTLAFRRVRWHCFVALVRCSLVVVRCSLFVCSFVRAETHMMTTTDYLKAGEAIQPRELAHGALRVADEPSISHQRTVGELFLAMAPFIEECGLGEILLAPTDVILDFEGALVVQPDIVFVSNERRYMAGDRVVGAPDLVIEVLSPRSRIGRLDEHIGWFARYGVRECWLVSLPERRVAVLTLDEHGVVRRTLHSARERLTSAVLPGFVMPDLLAWS